MGHKLLSFLLVALLTIQFSQAASTNNVYDTYTRKHAPMAQDQMRRYNIPASITLAQALLESGAGRGRLATAANNHFGIKCHDWRGPSILQDDDARNECFRKYESPSQSFEDHSLFLTRGARYRSLFDLDIRDYKGWAKGLQRAGYATDQGYANKLIKLIEDYQLYLYDNVKKGRVVAVSESTSTHNVYRSNGIIYVIARRGDTFESIAKEFDFNKKRLANYNELPYDAPLASGDVVYLEKKQKKAAEKFPAHEIQTGESMHSISQMYGVRMKYLYKINKKDKEYIPMEGDVLRLR
ncbi:MAG: glucosaminidase domain-containing protein [Bacteroidales bacterium]|jgi:LysM repeat protein|nr:glucosaminidase domain-containing protein [Bacteroidales bacterium]